MELSEVLGARGGGHLEDRLRGEARLLLEAEAVSLVAASLARELLEEATSELEAVEVGLEELAPELEEVTAAAEEANAAWAEVRWQTGEVGEGHEERCAPLREAWQEAEGRRDSVRGRVRVLEERRAELEAVCRDCGVLTAGVVDNGSLRVLLEARRV